MEKKTPKQNDKPKKRITWRQVSSSFSHRYGAIIWENAYDSQVVKIYHLHKRKDGRWYLIKTVHYKNGIEQRVLNFQNRISLYDSVQRN